MTLRLLEETDDKVFWKIYIAILVLCTALYASLLGGKYVWVDEAYTFAMLRHSFAEIWHITAADVHPPLYYFVCKFLTKPFGYSLLSAKIVSILPYLSIISFGGAQFRRLFGKEEALSFMLLFFFFPFSLQYSLEVRMYSWAAAFVFANAVFAYRCYIENKKSNWLLFVFFGACSAYTHYFALVSTGIVYGLLLLALCLRKKEKLRLWFAASALTAVLYLPWIKSFAAQLAYKVENEYWIGPITAKTFISYANNLFGGSGSRVLTVIFAFSYFLALIMVIVGKRKENAASALSSLAVPIGTVAVGVLASLLVRPVFIIRYIIPSIPLMVTFFALAVWSAEKPWLRIGSICTICISLIVGVIAFGKLFHSEYQIVPNALDRGFVERCSAAESYVVLTDSTHIQGVLSYYEPQKPVFAEPDGGNWAAVPHENMRPLEQFTDSENDTVVLLLDVGELPDEEFASVYQYDYLGQFEGGDFFDAYLLSK